MSKEEFEDFILDNSNPWKSLFENIIVFAPVALMIIMFLLVYSKF